jgi:hypothetical protein
MTTFELNAKTANLSIGHLLEQVQKGGLEVRDSQGKILAFVLSPTDQEALTYAEANIYLDAHKDQIQRALGRRGGITTSELLAKAASAAEKASQ